jgi:proline racemase
VVRIARAIQTVDSHTEGNPTRVVVGGVAVPPGTTLEQRRDWLIEHDDGLRQFLNFEPRGSAMMCSAILMPPFAATADFSVLLLEQDEYVPMCGHCMIGLATTVVDTGMVRASDGTSEIAFETLAGLVTATVQVRDGGVTAVTLRNVPSFLLLRDAVIGTESFGSITLDVAFGGDFYAIVDADRLGLELLPENEAQAAAVAAEVIGAVNDQLSVVHPDRPDINRCYETLFVTAKVRTGDVRHAVVSPPGAYDRSPCGTGSCARLAAMFARGQVALHQPVRFEGLLGTWMVGEVASAEQRDGLDIVRPLLTGRAYLTGFHTFLLDRDDPFPAGFRIGPQARQQTSAGGPRTGGSAPNVATTTTAVGLSE